MTETLKLELEDLLERGLTSHDTRLVEEIYKAVAEKTNELRGAYGLAALQAPSVVLRPPTEQLELAGVGTEATLGPAVLRRALATAAADAAGDDDARSWFVQAFLDPRAAARYRDAALTQANRSFGKDRGVMVLPPLVARGLEARAVPLQVTGDGAVRVTEGEPSLLVVVFADGPIVPIARTDVAARLDRAVQRLYALYGVVSYGDVCAQVADAAPARGACGAQDE